MLEIFESILKCHLEFIVSENLVSPNMSSNDATKNLKLSAIIQDINFTLSDETRDINCGVKSLEFSTQEALRWVKSRIKSSNAYSQKHEFVMGKKDIKSNSSRINCNHFPLSLIRTHMRNERLKTHTFFSLIHPFTSQREKM